MRIAVGIVEVQSIAAGVRAADAMLKTAQVDLLDAGAVSPGKYIITVGGDVASVAAAVESGVAEAGEQLLGQVLIAHLHPQVLAAVRGEAAPGVGVQAVGLVETATVAGVIRAADAAAKTAVVDLLELRLARGLGGKGYVTFTGDVGSVQVGVAAAADAAARDGALVGSAVIPAPHPDLWPKLRRDG
ncbi:MAG: microcompartment protein [Symbiobacteriaceae bacterium]|jgi:microcompartment protein CcmL/EutN|nr:microcompartment protein [Symbiobacteriaceae bacterium]